MEARWGIDYSSKYINFSYHWFSSKTKLSPKIDKRNLSIKQKINKWSMDQKAHWGHNIIKFVCWLENWWWLKINIKEIEMGKQSRTAKAVNKISKGRKKQLVWNKKNRITETSWREKRVGSTHKIRSTIYIYFRKSRIKRCMGKRKVLCSKYSAPNKYSSSCKKIITRTYI